MNSDWRDNVGKLRQKVNGSKSTDFRADWLSIANKPTNWRDAIKSFCNGKDWRGSLRAKAYELGKIQGNGWRDDLQWILDHYDGEIIEKIGLYTSNDEQFIDVNGLVFVVR